MITRTILTLTALTAALFCSGCASDPANASNATFQCGSSTLPNRPSCLYNSQYCLVVTQGGTSTPSCVPVPSACSGAGSPCSCIQAMLDGGSPACSSIALNGLRATIIDINR